MRLIFSMLILLATVAMLRGQDGTTAQSNGEKVAQDIFEKMRYLQPPDWSYAALAAKADLIAIAKAQSSVEVEWNEEMGGDFTEKTAQMVSNRLRILALLKGESATEIDVITLGQKPHTMVLSNFAFAEFRPKLLLPAAVPVVIDGQIAGYGEAVQGSRTHTVEPEYLVYLRRIDGNTYIPVTGQRYSRLSVRRLD